MWVDTEIAVVRSRTHTKTWCASIPGTEIATIIDSAGPIRACQHYVTDFSRYYVECAAGGVYDRIQWRPGENDDVRVLWVWVEN